MGNNNTGTGVGALQDTNIGVANTANGTYALASNTNGSFNTADGASALPNNTSGSNNIGLGVNAGSAVATANNVICIGTNLAGADVSDSCYIGNIIGAIIDPATAAAVGVDASGKLGTVASSRRFKQDIRPMDKSSEAILRLKPVTFHYKSDAKNTACFGLVAEEVAEVNPDLVVRDKDGGIYSVRYDQVNAMLLNEFLREHKRVEEQQVTIAALQSGLTRQEKKVQAKLAEQDRQIKALTSGLQRVSAQIEVGRRGPQVVKTP
jgi:hypothetical protein